MVMALVTFVLPLVVKTGDTTDPSGCDFLRKTAIESDSGFRSQGFRGLIFDPEYPVPVVRIVSVFFTNANILVGKLINTPCGFWGRVYLACQWIYWTIWLEMNISVI
jgi:hypothetical protein